jgi:hypothetical protein
MATKPYNAREITRQLNIALDKDFAATTFAIFRNLVTGSPVGNPDTWQGPAPAGYVGGHFRRNWQVTVGGFSDAELEGQDAAGATTLAVGKSKIDGFVRGGGGANLVIQNNVPYANRLAQGWSPQAKAGWVDREIDAALPFPGGRKVVP